MVNSQLNLKSIIHSKRVNMYYLELCRIKVKEDRIVYLTNDDKEKLYWNIPIANTTFILLGTGTSISQGAVRLLASAGVMIGFAGTGGTPLLAGTSIEWLSPQNEYRPTEYLQGWMSFWFDEDKRLDVAKEFQYARLDFIEKIWKKDFFEDLNISLDDIRKLFEGYESNINKASSVSFLLSSEAHFTKDLYKYLSMKSNLNFSRDHSGQDSANKMLNHGNYLAYGTAATCLWSLGIPFGFAVMHGKTRRGALIFDVADLVKDAIILPLSFKCARDKMNDIAFRGECIKLINKSRALDYMFDIVKKQSKRGF